MFEKKIIFVHLFNSFSGSPKVLETTINVLRQKYDCVLVTNNTDGFLDNVDVRKVIFKFELSPHKLVTLFRYFIAQITIFYHIARLANSKDIVYVNTTIPIFAAIAGKFKNAKVVFHLHEDRTSLNIVHRALSSLRRFFCDFEIFVSQYLWSKEHVSGIDCKVIPNALPEEFIVKARGNNLKPQLNRPFIVLMVCSLKRYKGVWELLEICKHLESTRDIQFHLVLSENDKVISEYFNGTELPANLHLHAKTNDIAKHFVVSSVLLNLSRPDEWVETFGLTILEGMVYGLPCIVPPVGGPTELVYNDVNGFTVSAYDTKKICGYILRLYEDDRLYNRMSAKSREISGSFTLSRFKTELVYSIDKVEATTL